MRFCRKILYICEYCEYNKTMVKIKSVKIYKIINEKGYTLKKFASVVGITLSELNKILNNDFNFKFISLVKLARYFDVDVDWLLNFGEIKEVTKFYL